MFDLALGAWSEQPLSRGDCPLAPFYAGLARPALSPREMFVSASAPEATSGETMSGPLFPTTTIQAANMVTRSCCTNPPRQLFEQGLVCVLL